MVYRQNGETFLTEHALTSALRESEERFRRLAENAPEIIYRYRLHPDRAFEYVNPAVTDITGYTPEEHYADPDLGIKLVHPEDRERLQQITLGISTAPFVIRWICKDGRLIWTEHRIVPVYDDAGQLIAIEGLARDITDRKLAEEQLKDALEYKTMLLQEVQHRTRNNMNMLSSLLMFQAQYIEDAQAQRQLQALQARIDAMALLHQKLHQPDLMVVNLREYTEELVQVLMYKYSLHSDRIRFSYDVAPISMIIDPAISFGLMLYEILSNAVQHGFPDERRGEIHISLHAFKDGTRKFCVRDNGVGLPEGFDETTAPSLGFKLMTMMAQSLRGHLDVRRCDPGTEVVVCFKEREYKKRI